MLARPEAAPPGSRDLPHGGGPIARLHLWAGDALIWGLNLLRPPLMFGVRLIAFDAAGRVFLVRHSYRPGWHLPGGGVEAGETAREAMLREAAEEGGLLFDSEPLLFQLYHHATTGRRDHIVAFVVRDAHQAKGRDAAGLEIRENGFFDPTALPDGTTPATRARVAEVLAGGTPSDHW